MEEKYGIWIDDILLCEYLKSLNKQARVYFYRAEHYLKEVNSVNKSPKAQMLTKMGVKVVERPIQLNYSKKEGRMVRSGNLDVPLAMNMVDFLHKHGGRVKKVILATGDGDLFYLLDRIRGHRTQNPIRADVMGWNGITSHLLLEQCDHFFPLDRILPTIKTKYAPASDLYAGVR